VAAVTARAWLGADRYGLPTTAGDGAGVGGNGGTDEAAALLRNPR